jgi:hypothetical protein
MWRNALLAGTLRLNGGIWNAFTSRHADMLLIRAHFAGFFLRTAPKKLVSRITILEHEWFIAYVQECVFKNPAVSMLRLAFEVLPPNFCPSIDLALDHIYCYIILLTIQTNVRVLTISNWLNSPIQSDQQLWFCQHDRRLCSKQLEYAETTRN